MRRTWPAAVAATLCLGASTPPALVPLAEWLVLPGLALVYAIARHGRRPYLTGYLIGVVHLLWLSWSLRHVSVASTIGIGLLGGLYTLLIVAWTRAGMRLRAGAPWFALGVAAMAWLRGHVAEIPYPHGQPVHALYEWPLLLAPLRVGGEPLVNLLLGLVAAGIVDTWNAWRVAIPSMRAALTLLGAGVGLWFAGVVAGVSLRSADEPGPMLRVVAVQPGPFGSLANRRSAGEWLRERLIAPTAAIAGRAVENPPDLVLWPESTLPLTIGDDPPRILERGRGLELHPHTTFVGGGLRETPEGARIATATQLDAEGELVTWHEKRVAVPGGERLPFADLLPEWLKQWLVQWGTSLTDDVPDIRAGSLRAPLVTPGGVEFAALICFDNAFDDVVRREVDAGARLLAVLSNESWFHQGAELDQMVAMTVCRAIETGTPIVRATLDGATLAVGPAGEILAEAPRGSGPEILDVTLATGPGRLGPLSWLPRALAFAALAAGIAVVWHLLQSRGRLSASRLEDHA